MLNKLDDDEFNYNFKIVLTGECEVGKTCIWQNYMKDQIQKKTVPTIGIEFENKFITMADGSKVKAQIWDTAGQERYRSITSSHFRKAIGALLVFDITKKETFDKLLRWIEDLKMQGESDMILWLVGNKLDLVQKNLAERKVDEETIKQFSKQYKCKYSEISAFSQEDVQKVFESLILDLCKMRNGYRGGEQSQLNLMKQSNNLNERKQCSCKF